MDVVLSSLYTLDFLGHDVEETYEIIKHEAFTLSETIRRRIFDLKISIRVRISGGKIILRLINRRVKRRKSKILVKLNFRLRAVEP